MGVHGRTRRPNSRRFSRARCSARCLTRRTAVRYAHRRPAAGPTAGSAAARLLDRRRARSRRPAHPRDDGAGRRRSAFHRGRRVHVDEGRCQGTAQRTRRTCAESSDPRLARFAGAIPRVVPAAIARIHGGARTPQRSDVGEGARLLGFSPRPAATTVVECAESVLSPRAL